MTNIFKQQEEQNARIKRSMQSVKHLIAIASGKGGVGKSTVAANLALSLAKEGYNVGLADADIYGPSVPTLFNIANPQIMAYEKDGQQLMIPMERFGIKLMSVGFFVNNMQPLAWRGPMASNTLIQILADTEWGELDFLLLDLPPGTGDIQLTLAQLFPVEGAVIVSTPQELAKADVRRAVSMFREKGIETPVLGLVENMAYFVPPAHPDEKYHIFGKEGCIDIAKELDIELLAQIPIGQDIADANDSGNPIAMDFEAENAKVFMDLADKITAKLTE